MEHHERRFLHRLMQAEEVTDPVRAKKIIEKAEKHRRKIARERDAGDSTGENEQHPA